ncbi:MAG: CPBP family intramembrane metalloprotease [Kiritimatiellae bacterium]|nr:CPBP family intramembrane metalloprotease [Kiritimatiellia bacterium]
MSTRGLWGYVAGAYVLMMPLFAWRRVGALDFWWWMAANGLLLSVAGLLLDRELRGEMGRDLRARMGLKLAGGLAAALVLGAVFAVGNALLRRVWPEAGGMIGRVYALGEGASKWRIALLLALVIGPAEEIVWRGVVQRGLTARLGAGRGIAAAVALYTGIHVATGNPVLLLAAAVAGLAWGWMYHRWRSLAANMVSHAAWDVAVFVLFPFG